MFTNTRYVPPASAPTSLPRQEQLAPVGGGFRFAPPKLGAQDAFGAQPRTGFGISPFMMPQVGPGPETGYGPASSFEAAPRRYNPYQQNRNKRFFSTLRRMGLLRGF